MIVTPDTRLDAVNQILASIGEAPVVTLEDPTNADVIDAIRTLDVVSRRIQAKGWSFNKHESFYLNPDTTENKIPWNSTFLYLKGADGTRLVKRGDYVYDFDNQTFTFTQSIEVVVVFLQDFDDLPEAARWYITALAAKEFEVRSLGDPDLTEELERDEQKAWQAFFDFELEFGLPNMFDNPGVQKLTRRS